MLFLLSLKWNLYGKGFSVLKETNSNFAVKAAEKSNSRFSVYFINFIFAINWIIKLLLLNY